VARRSKKKLLRALFFLAILGVLLFVAMSVMQARRSRARRILAPLRTPAAGAASSASSSSEGGGGGDAIVEDARRYPVMSWSFALDRYELRIEDANMTTALDSVLTKSGSELIVNGGFFDPDGKGVGLAMSEGAILSKLKTSLSGGVLTSNGSRALLFATEGFSLVDGGADAHVPAFAIQCRPRLVVDRAANVKSDDGKRAERTALCTRDDGRVVDVIIVRRSDDGESPGPSLFALAKHLAEGGCDAALNLDGGPSTGVAWRDREGGVGSSPDGAVKLIAPRGPVRYAIAFREKR
jgi:uncharacterized protein YigE (DUF2233 family)